MHSSRKLEIIKSLRMLTVLGIGAFGVLATSFFVANGLRNEITAGATLTNLTATALGVTFIGLFVTAILCLLVFHTFSFFESTTLSQAIRLNEAMRLLHAKTNKESLAALRYYRIDVFRAPKPLGEDAEKNVHCKLISTFLAPWAFRSDQNAAFGSEYHCCDFEHIQTIIADNKAKWGDIPEELPGGTPVEVTALQRKIANLLEENKKANLKFTAANGRESLLKERLTEVESHMAVLVELANKISAESRRSGKITKEAFKDKYLAIVKICRKNSSTGAERQSRGPLMTSKPSPVRLLAA